MWKTGEQHGPEAVAGGRVDGWMGGNEHNVGCKNELSRVSLFFTIRVGRRKRMREQIRGKIFAPVADYEKYLHKVWYKTTYKYGL